VSAGINTTMLYNFPTWLVLQDQTSRNQKRQATFFLFVDFHGIYIPSQKVNGAFSVIAMGNRSPVETGKNSLSFLDIAGNGSHFSTRQFLEMKSIKPQEDHLQSIFINPI